MFVESFISRFAHVSSPNIREMEEREGEGEGEENDVG